MKHNTIAEMHEILNAIEQGKEVQYQHVCTKAANEWFDAANKQPNFAEYTYRIKPEEPKKKWRPFRDTEELFDHNNGHDVLRLKSKTSGECSLVTMYGSDHVWMICSWNMEELLERFTFKDGTPCGVEEDA